MTQQEPRARVAPADRRGWSPAAGLALLLLLSYAAGVGLVVVTDAVENSGIEGAGWSLRGNGALIVPICGVPVLLVVGWTLLLLWLRPVLRSGLGGLAAGIIVLLLAALLSYFSSPVLLPVILVAALIAAVLLARGAESRRAFGWSLAGALLLPAALAAGFLTAVSRLVPR